MRRYSEGERCMMLLFAPLGEEKPLSRSGYKGLAKALAALGRDGADPMGELTERELLRLGASREDAETILSRLGRSGAL